MRGELLPRKEVDRAWERGSGGWGDLLSQHTHRKEIAVTKTTLIRLGAVASIGAALLAVAALVGFVAVVGSDPIADHAGTAAFYVPATASLGSMLLLALGLVGLYLRQEDRFGGFGAASFTLALLVTVLAAGGQWTYVFVIPHIAGAVPEIVNEGKGSVLVGFVLSYAVLALGWILFGLATLRAGIVPRWASLFIVGGAAIAFLPMPSRTLVLSVAMALVGARLLRESGATERTPANAPMLGR
jgi:hypothetical protein